MDGKADRRQTLQATTAILVVVLLAGVPAAAQTREGSFAFVDGGVVIGRDVTSDLPAGFWSNGARGAAGFTLWTRQVVQIESDVALAPQVDRPVRQGIYCAPSAGCPGGTGWVPARVGATVSARTISLAVLYGVHLFDATHARLTVLAGCADEIRQRRYDTSIDELSATGAVLRHTETSYVSAEDRAAGILGADVELKMSRQWSLTPQVRWQAAGDRSGLSLLRSGVGLRWHF